MKKFLIILGVLLIGTCSFAEDVYLLKGVNLDNYWKKKGIDKEKVLTVGQKIMIDNKIIKRAPIFVINDKKTLNAYSNIYYKTINIYTPLFLYMDNDSELAFVLSHEIAHTIEAYGGTMKYIAMTANSKKYEYKADLNGIDYMVKAGYDPIGAITISNKIFAEPVLDWGFFATHPKGSKRLLAMYKYIYVKYPKYLNSPLTQTASYKNFELMMSKEIQEFQQKQQKRRKVNIESSL